VAVSVVMPALEMAQETGKLLAWRKKEGDAVKKGEALLEIETDKAVVEVEAQADGILASVTAHEGAVIPVGHTIAWLLQAGETVPAPAEIKISPKARRIAKERGVDLATITGSGPGGEIVADDVLTARKSEGSSSKSEVSSLKSEVSGLKAEASSVARLMAERTTQSWTTVPHFFVSRDVDATALNAAHEKMTGVSHTDLLVSLVARTLAKHPRMNASWIDQGVRLNADVNVAIAIAVEDAVVTGVVRAADRASVADITSRRKELTDRARAGRLQPADITGATFTISNLGMFQVDAFTAIIVPPQAGILAVGAITDRIVAVYRHPTVRPMMTLTLSCDHRVVDGARAAAFLSDLITAMTEAAGSHS
jgi:pyruvate dehydrogenase E2 component (dihydrolipoyllysine-residue acetyltransferase)